MKTIVFITVVVAGLLFAPASLSAKTEDLSDSSFKVAVIYQPVDGPFRESVNILYNQETTVFWPEDHEYYITTGDQPPVARIKTDLMRKLMFESGCMLDSLSMSENTLEIYFREKVPKWKLLSEFVNKLIRILRNDIAPQAQLDIDFSGANPMVVKVASP